VCGRHAVDFIGHLEDSVVGGPDKRRETIDALWERERKKVDVRTKMPCK
jgi:hypothetical protein